MIEQIKQKVETILSFDAHNSQKLSQSTMEHAEHSHLILEVLEEGIPYLIGEMEAAKGNVLLWRDKATAHQREVEEMQNVLQGLVNLMDLTGYLKLNQEYRDAVNLLQSIQGGNTP